MEAVPLSVAAPEPYRRLPAARPVALALQGGGSLGAFAWGVLDRLLDAPELRIEMVSGTSAGAMNAALLVQGLATGDAAEAKRLLEAFWRRVAAASGSPDIAGPDWLCPFGGIAGSLADAFRRTTAGALRRTARGLSQRQLNPLGLNPLQTILADLLEPSVFGREGAPGLVVSATRVRTGEARLFRDAEVTADVLLASACLPQLFPAVEIEGEPYWDGGYSSNPPVGPLIVEAEGPTDLVIVRTTPVERPEPPSGVDGISERISEIAFGAALRQELRYVAVAQRLLAEQPPETPGALARLRDARLHMIGAEEEFRALPGGSGLDARWVFLQKMRDLGHDAADRWLGANLASVGVRSTVDLRELARPSLGLHAGEDGQPRLGV